MSSKRQTILLNRRILFIIYVSQEMCILFVFATVRSHLIIEPLFIKIPVFVSDPCLRQSVRQKNFNQWGFTGSLSPSFTHLGFSPFLSIKSEIFCYCVWRIRSNTGSRADWFYSNIDGHVWPIAAAQGLPQSPSAVAAVDKCVSNHSSPKRHSFHSPLDHCFLSDVLMLLLITFTVSCMRMHTPADAADRVHPESAAYVSLRFHLTPTHIPISLTLKQPVNMNM